MTLEQLIIKYQGKFVEVAGSPNALNQCTDLANLYIRDVLGLPIIEWTNAVDFPTKADKTKYDYILNTPLNIPKEGDLIVWKPSPGHIAVFIEGNVDNFRSFDENFPTGSPCHIQNHTYVNVIGWLHPKISALPPSEELGACLVQHTQLVDSCNKKDAEITRLNNLNSELSNDIDGFESQIQHYTDYEKQLAATLNCAVDEAIILGEITKGISCNDQLRQTLKKNEDLTQSSALCETNLSKEEERANGAILQNTALAGQLSDAQKKIETLTTQQADNKYTYRKIWGKIYIREVLKK